MATSRPERIELARAEDPRDVVYRAVACLAQGGVVALPADTSYILAAGALWPEAVARLGRIKGRGESGPLPLALKSPEELPDWVPDASCLGLRLARRSWPGPVTLVVRGAVGRGLGRRLPPEVARRVAPGDAIGLRCPAHPAPRDILHLISGPLVVTGAPRIGADPAAALDALAAMPELDMVLDDGPVPPSARETVVRIDGDAWEVVRPGVIPADELARRASTVLLFICTGNTCRSPMAEALCRTRLADRLGCAPADLPARGYVVLSAGIAALRGMPAAAHAIEVVGDRGGSLLHHASRRVSADLVHQADLIIALAGEHRDALLDDYPEIADRVRLLHPWGEDIEDPIGADLDTYRHTAEVIEQHLAHLLDELGV